jgi:hypothetical protein
MKTIKFRDRSEIVVTDEQGEKIERLLLEGVAEYFVVDSAMYSRTSVDRISNGGQMPKEEKFVDPWATTDRMIGGKKCQSTRSIQSEINNIIKAEAGREWAKAIRDTDERERIRDILRNGDDAWCDYRAGTCVC